MDEADRYALEMLRRLDQQLSAFSNTIRTGITALEERSGEVSTTYHGASPEPGSADDYSHRDQSRE
jgi:hypothetical protein